MLLVLDISSTFAYVELVTVNPAVPPHVVVNESVKVPVALNKLLLVIVDAAEMVMLFQVIPFVFNVVFGDVCAIFY